MERLIVGDDGGLGAGEAAGDRCLGVFDELRRRSLLLRRRMALTACCVLMSGAAIGNLRPVVVVRVRSGGNARVIGMLGGDVTGVVSARARSRRPMVMAGT